MRRFGTQGRVYPDKHYVVARAEDVADFIDRVKDQRWAVYCFVRAPADRQDDLFSLGT